MNQLKPISILIVDTHPLLREGLRIIIGSQADMRVVAQASNAADAIAEFRRHRPDITLMNLRLPGADGIDVLITIRSEFPEARIIMHTSSDSAHEIQRALEAGAWAYTLKSIPTDELLAVIRSVHSGKKQVLSEIGEHLGEDLTTTEVEVLRLIYDGNRNKQIADKLAITETTVKLHIKNIVDKLGANDRIHAVSIAIRRGLLQV